MNETHKHAALSILHQYMNYENYRRTSYIVPFNIALCTFSKLNNFIQSYTAIEKITSLIFEHLDVGVYELESLESKMVVLLEQQECKLNPGVMDIWAEENFLFREILSNLFKHEMYEYISLEDIYLAQEEDVDLGDFLMFESLEYDGPESIILKFHYLEKTYELL